MFNGKKNDTRAMSISGMLMSVDVALVSFFVNFGNISHCVPIFLLLTLSR